MPTETTYGTVTSYNDVANPDNASGAPNDTWADLSSFNSSIFLTFSSGSPRDLVIYSVDVWIRTRSAGSGSSPNFDFTFWAAPGSQLFNYNGYLSDSPANVYTSWTPSGGFQRFTGWNPYCRIRYYEPPTGKTFSVDAVWVTIDYAPAQSNVTISDSATITASETQTYQLGINRSVADAPSLTADEQASYALVNTFVDASSLAAIDEVERQITAYVTDTPSLTATETLTAIAATRSATDVTSLTATETLTPSIRSVITPRRLRAVFRGLDGSVVGGTRTVLAASYELALDRIGSWSLECPSADVPDTIHAVDILREDEGVVARGLVSSVTYRLGAAGEEVAKLTGPSVAGELARPTIVSYAATETAISTIAGAIVSPYGWTAQAITTPATVTIQGLSPWQALARVADYVGASLIEDPLTRTVRVITTYSPSGFSASNYGPPWRSERDANWAVIGAEVERDESGLTTRVIPRAETVDGRTAQLEESTRTSPYTILSGTAEDGSTYYYLEDNTSVYGVRTKLITWRGIYPLDDSAAEEERAANALYDAAAAYLDAHSQPISRLRINVLPTYHVDDSGRYRFLPGDTVRIRLRAVPSDSGVKVDIDANYHILGIKRSFGSAGEDQWTLDLADRPVQRPDAIDQISGALSEAQSVLIGLPPWLFSLGGSGGGGGGSTTRTVWDIMMEHSTSNESPIG